MGEEPVDLDQVRRDIESCRGSHAALDSHLRGRGYVDPTAPSRLPGWTIGHVLTHIARNADGHRSMLDGRHQYPHGADGRHHDIETGAARAWDELIDDVGATNTTLEARWDGHHDWAGVSVMLSGTRPTAQLPFLRQREVEVHRVDLGLGYEFGDMPSEYVRRELRLMGMLWKARKPMGMTPLPEAALALPPATRLAWMMGRLEVSGLAPADLL